VFVSLAVPFIWPNSLDPIHLLGAIYAAWVGGVALFALVGLVVAIASLARPEQDHFEARARNLVRGKTGNHIDYILRRLKEIVEPYVEYTERRFIISGYDEAEKKIHVACVTKTSLKSFLDDIETEFTGFASYADACAPPPGAGQNCLVYVKVGDKTVVDYKEFGESIKEEFNVVIPRHGHTDVEHRLDYWIRDTEEDNRLHSVRYTRRIKLVFENGLSRKVVHVHWQSCEADKNVTEIKPGESRTVINLSEISPRENVYDFVLSCG
jgi:hypothetical protein